MRNPRSKWRFLAGQPSNSVGDFFKWHFWFPGENNQIGNATEFNPPELGIPLKFSNQMDPNGGYKMVQLNFSSPARGYKEFFSKQATWGISVNFEQQKYGVHLKLSNSNWGSPLTDSTGMNVGLSHAIHVADPVRHLFRIWFPKHDLPGHPKAHHFLS